MAERGDKQIRVVNGPLSKDKRRLFDIIRSGRFQRNFLSVPLTKALPMHCSLHNEPQWTALVSGRSQGGAESANAPEFVLHTSFQEKIGL